MKCENCQGTGHVYILIPVESPPTGGTTFSNPVISHCEECKGSGKIETKQESKKQDKFECHKCKGKGTIEVFEKDAFEAHNIILSLWVKCPECVGQGRFGISEELKKEIELHNQIRQLISDYIGEGVDNNMRKCVDKIIELMKEYYKEMEYKSKIVDKEFDDLVRKSYEEK